jgi:tetratricopeptide (TPR) repeat protein
MITASGNVVLVVAILVSSLLLTPEPCFCQEPGIPEFHRKPDGIGREVIRGKILFDEGKALYESARTEEDLERAAEKFKQAGEVWESIGLKRGATAAAIWQGRTQLDQKKFDKAMEKFQKASEQLSKGGDTEWEGGTMIYTGNVYLGRGQLEKAEEFYKKALDVATGNRNTMVQGRSLKRLADVDRLKGDPIAALEKYRQAMEVAENAGDNQCIGYALSGSGRAHLALGHYDKAAEQFERALEMSKRTPNVRDQAEAHEQLGQMYRASGRNRLAIEHLRKGMEQSELSGDLKQVTQDLCTLGSLHLDRGQYNMAVEAFLMGLDKAKKIRNTKLEGESLKGLGRVYNILGNYPKALENLQGSLEVARKNGRKKEEAESLTFLGQLFFKWGKHGRAIDLFEQALRMSKTTGDKIGETEALIQLGLLYEAIGQHDKSLETLSRAKIIAKRDGPTSQRIDDLMANLYLDMGELQKAESLIAKSGSEPSKGRLYLLKQDYAKAAHQYETLAQQAQNSGNVDNFFTANTGLGLAQEALGEFASAAESFRKAVESVEEIRSTLSVPERSEFFNVRIGGFLRTAPYEGIARVSVKINRPADGLRESELTKARGFSEAISRRVEGVFQDIPTEVMEKDLEANEHLAALLKRRQSAHGQGQNEVIQALEPQIKFAKAHLEAHIEQLRADYPLFAATKYPAPPDLGNTAIRTGEWVLAYHVTDEGILIYLTRGKQIIKGFFKPVARGEFEALLRKFMTPVKVVPGQDDLVQKLKAFDFASGKKLTDLLVGDILLIVPEGAAIIVSPDDCLGTLPFEMLPLSGEGLIEETAGLPQTAGVRFLGDRNPLVYCQSITALTLTRTLANPTKPKDKLLVIADPVFDTGDPRVQKPAARTTDSGGDKNVYRLMSTMKKAGVEGLGFKRLPLTGELAEGLKRLYADKSDVFTGLDATKEAFYTTIGPSLALYGSIVFATHGYLDSSALGMTEPLLVFSLVPLGTEGFLRASEVMGLKFNADTVVLGACETGLGRQVPGEGTLGMGRSFQYAGGRNVLMSMWSVAERPSVGLVENFFKHVKSGKGRLEALRLARSDVRQAGFDHPFFWAPFVLFGEAE